MTKYDINERMKNKRTRMNRKKNNEEKTIDCVTWKNTKLSDFQRVWRSLPFG